MLFLWEGKSFVTEPGEINPSAGLGAYSDRGIQVVFGAKISQIILMNIMTGEKIILIIYRYNDIICIY